MNSSQAISSSDFNGFGADDNWATAALASTASTTSTTSPASLTNTTKKTETTTANIIDSISIPEPKVAVGTHHNDSSHFGADWANFDDGTECYYFIG